MVAKATQPKEFKGYPLTGTQTVFDGNSPNPSAWTILNLENWVGKRSAFVVLSIVSAGAGNAGYAVKNPIWAAGGVPNNFPANAGGCYAVDLPQAVVGFVCICTNQDGQIKWYCDAVDRQTEIVLECFMA